MACAHGGSLRVQPNRADPRPLRSWRRQVMPELGVIALSHFDDDLALGPSHAAGVNLLDSKIRDGEFKLTSRVPPCRAAEKGTSVSGGKVKGLHAYWSRTPYSQPSRAAPRWLGRCLRRHP